MPMANGTLATGKGTKGLNRINVDGKPNGFYVPTIIQQ